MIRTVITGVTGRMGGTLLRLVRESKDLELAGATARQVSRLEALGVSGGEDLGRVLDTARAQVVIDFTSAEASVAHARQCAERGVAMVIGSTGFTPESRAELAVSAK